MEMVNIKINGMPLSVPAGSTILEAARYAGINIPTLCWMKDLNEIGACRICVVEVVRAKTLVTACVYPVNEGMEIYTNSPRVMKARKMTLELMLSTHDKKYLSCVRSENCELQKLCRDYGVEDVDAFEGENPQSSLDETTLHMVRDNNKCILCRRCVAACEDQFVGVIGPNGRGFDTHIGCAFEKDLGDVACVSCGQCIVNCPTGALREKDQIDEVVAAIADSKKHVVVQTAPSVRAALGEEFGMPIGTNVEGKMVAALRRLGFDKVFDTDFGADMTIMEEAHEFIDRVQNGGALPLITSCSPGWIKFCEFYYPELLPNLSSCKSPQQMQGALIKTWYAETHNIDPKDIVSVSVMPCTAKKFEISRDDQDAAGVPDVDVVLTVRELARMIKRANIDLTMLPDEKFDPTMDVSTGAAVIFGATGGVMEAALRTAADTLTGKSLDSIDYEEVRGTDGIKEAVYNVAGMDVKVAVASGLSNANEILKKVKNGEADYHFIEIMCCPGGCVNGGGTIRFRGNYLNATSKRFEVLERADENSPVRQSHNNPMVKELYDEFLGEPNSHKAHQLLHTSYDDRSKTPAVPSIRHVWKKIQLG